MASLKSCKAIFLLVLSSLVITFSLVQGAICREGFHQTDKGYCCWPTSCLKNQQFQLCTHDHGSDTCTPCDDGLVSLEQINTSNWSYFYDLCHVPKCECAPEAKLENPLECNKSGIAVCLCNREEWLYGKDPLTCQKANDTLKKSAMKRGMELKLNGTVGNCPPGYFKAESGSSICSPHSKCLEGESVEFPGTIFQDVKCKRNPSTSVATLPIGPTPPSSTSPAKVPKSANENNVLLTWVLVAVLGVFAIVAVVLGLILVCWMKKRRTSAVAGDSVNINVEVSVDPESGSLKPLIENEKNDLSASPVSQDCYSGAENSIAASQKQEHLKGRDDQERCFNEELQFKKKNPLLESGQTCTKVDSIGLEGSPLDLTSLLDSGPKSDTYSTGNYLSNFYHISVVQESFGGSLQTTSEDLGIGLSADSKNVNEIQKSGQTPGTEEKLVHGEY